MQKSVVIKTIIAFTVAIAICICIILINKFQYSIDYSKNVRIEIYTGKKFEINEIKEITNEVFKNQETVIQKAGAFQDGIAITLKMIDDAQKENLIIKINEKYGTELTVEDIEVYYNSNVRGRDLIANYYWLAGISGILILAFFVIRYHKLGIIKVLGTILGIVLLGLILYLTLISLFGIEVNSITIPSMIAILICSFAYLSSCYEKKVK